MTFSYDPSEATALDQVRGILGDTRGTDRLLEDETITAVLTNRSDNVPYAALDCAKRIRSLLGRQHTKSAIGMSDSPADRLNSIDKLIEDLQSQVNFVAVGYAGGVSTAAKEAILNDGDFEAPLATRTGMFES